MEVALKIDVDTHQGMMAGVPALADLLARERVAASFYVAMGPDNSGKAVTRMARNRGFLSKMMRTKAVSMYGLRTVLSGTLLPSRPVALAFPATMRMLKERGFEVGVHGYDHVRWQDRLDAIGEPGLRIEIEEAFECYRAIFREPSSSFAAPGWRTNPEAERILAEMKLAYQSNTRGRAPFRCRAGGDATILEIPTTMPTLDEVMGRGVGDDDSMVRYYLERISADALNVHTIHAETEGMNRRDGFARLVRALKDRGARFVKLGEVAARLADEPTPICEVIRTTVEGRAGWISAQGPELPGATAAMSRAAS